MKEESNNAIDLMLRQLGRSGSRLPQSSGNGEPESSQAHLDTDELSAYAENALPVTARARYTEHLAECGRCRQIVSQLSQATGVVVEDARKGVPVSGLKAFLASLMSPVVLRYAVPALGLLVMASIGFLALRQSGSRQLAEQRVSNTDRVAVVTPTPGEAGATPPAITPSVNFATKAAPHTTSTPQEEADKNERTKLADDSRQQDKEQPREKAATSTDQVAAAAPASAPTGNAPAASPKPTVVADEKQAADEVAQNKVQAAAPQSAEVRGAKANDEPASRRPAKEPTREIASLAGSLKKGKTDSTAATGSADSARGEEVEGKRERDRNDKDKAETASVAGHRFRKSGSVWIDVAFESSQATTSVRRGSEQYRALIADEPGIRTVAEQLQGEVILVWKGRAYRIR